ncbi:hypothetical protein BC832DRAFT_537231 [Gaertneriomyces semiglobifer]|nr:hypothetical protein BC832DRAFT_537231 [Gaertneriomyces semiglobifer]
MCILLMCILLLNHIFFYWPASVCTILLNVRHVYPLHAIVLLSVQAVSRWELRRSNFDERGMLRDDRTVTEICGWELLGERLLGDRLCQGLDLRGELFDALINGGRLGFRWAVVVVWVVRVSGEVVSSMYVH